MDTRRTANDGQAIGVIMIPARVSSTRLPQKLMLALSGRPLLSYAIERAKAAVRQFPLMFREVYVVADDERLCRIAEDYGARSILSRLTHENGTSRIAAAVGLLNRTLKLDFVVNLQADHPQVAPEAMARVAKTLLDFPAAHMTTAAVAMSCTDVKSIEDPNIVKIDFDRAMQAKDFSRKPIRQKCENDRGQSTVWYRHVGLYAYRTDFLSQYASLSPGERERTEDLEQLRALEHHAEIQVVTVPADQVGFGIDTAEDYNKFVNHMGMQFIEPILQAGDR